MSQPHPSKSYRAREQKQRGIDPEITKAPAEDYAGETAEYGYSQTIFNLLRDPVSLGLVGGNNTRGHQR